MQVKLILEIITKNVIQKDNKNCYAVNYTLGNYY